MPYIRQGKCVFKKNADGSKGKKVGCSDTVEKAKAHVKALYMAENKSLSQFSMAIVKASITDKANRTMRIRMVNSDTDEDSFDERMSVELFNDFVERIENDSPVPEPFNVICEDGWCGGMPYPSISHYKSGAGKNVPGEIEKVYVDGERLKSSAILHENSLGLAVWKSICTDIEDANKPIEERSFSNPVRISIGFLDLEHKHEIDDEDDYIFTRTKLKQKCSKCEEGINGKVYLKGQLVHLAFTRVPANPRTSVEVFKMSDEIETKKDDAQSIIGDLAEELVGKSSVEDEALVVKAEDDSRDEPDEKFTVEKADETSEEVMSEEVTTEEVMEEPQEEPVVEEPQEEPVAATPEPQKSLVEESLAAYNAKMAELKEKGITGEEAVKAIQPLFNKIGEATKSELESPMDKTAQIVEAAVTRAIEAYDKKRTPELVAEVLKSIPSVQKEETKPEIPTPRSILLERTDVNQEKKSQLQELAEKTVGVAGQ